MLFLQLLVLNSTKIIGRPDLSQGFDEYSLTGYASDADNAVVRL